MHTCMSINFPFLRYLEHNLAAFNTKEQLKYAMKAEYGKGLSGELIQYYISDSLIMISLVKEE